MKEKDKEVGKIYESYDYDSFTVLKENRGRSSTDGIAPHKLAQFNRMHDNGEYFEEIALVQVNLKRQVVGGLHTFIDRKLREMPIRFIIISDPRFNEVSKRSLVLNAVFNCNKNTTKWSRNELFNAAIELGSGLATRMNLLMSKHNNTFKWTDLLALLLKREEFFSGHTDRIPSRIFDKRNLAEEIDSPEFMAEFKYFLKINDKARSAYKKATFLRAAFEIIFKGRGVMNPMLVRKCILTIPDDLIGSRKANSLPKVQKMIIDWVNKEGGQQYVASTIFFEIKNQISQQVKEIIKEEEEFVEA